MGKKSKIGKQRKDKYYQLAKETGYRSRAAFKLIQLNRKFGFLQKSRVCIDLCAAPGGWMQVAHQNMPLSSIVIGVDLFPIKTVPGCISLTEDITTEKCRVSISKELKTWKADIVLNDGAPNVGLNWLHDAYQQATLTLSALKLATNFLKEGGWFVTKVFRSKDYHPLLWVFKQLFKKVHATKPQASRNESSEIFVVCQHYVAPDLIDPKFLDAKYVFDEFELETKSKFNILHPEKQKKAKAEGYRENDYTQHLQVSVLEFLAKEDPIDLLRGCSEILIDDKAVKSHPRTTREIIECCKDIKVLGRKDIKLLLSWLKAVKASRPEETPVVEVPVEPQEPEESEDDDKKEEKEVDAKILELQDEERRDSKRKRKLLNKQRQKLAERMNLKMVLKGDGGPVLESDDMFKLQDIKNVNQLQKMTDQLPEVTAVSDEESEDETKLKPKYMKYNTEDSHLHSSGSYYQDSDSELEMENDSESDDDKASLGLSDSEGEDDVKKITKLNTKKNSKMAKVKSKGHPLLNDLDDRDEKTVRSRKAENWFNKDSFKEFDEDEDEDMDLDKLAHTYKKKGKKILDKALVKDNFVSIKRQTSAKSVDSGVHSDDTDDETSDSDYEVETKLNPKAGKEGAAASEDTFDVVPQDPELKRLKKSLMMDEEALSLGTMLATSRKFKRDLIDDSWNRYMFADKNLPDWFVEDESKNMKKPVIVPEKYADEYKNRLQEINVRPIKKVVEAKARKKKRMLKKMERAKKKVESVMDNADMSEREKARQVKQLYKKATTERKKEVTYVVARKHTTSKRMKKPAGVKGRYKVVDPRQKKDLRATKAQDKKNKKFKRPAPVKRSKKGNKAK